jgi:small-conductance mechanosensitive channel
MIKQAFDANGIKFAFPTVQNRRRGRNRQRCGRASAAGH